jgi:segregation and condensation protein A
MTLPPLPSLKHHPCSVSLAEAEFEGPLDLLLHLVEHAKLDITAVSLVQVTGQYLAYMRAEEQIDHRALADFVAIGARLIELKSRALLPLPPPIVEPEEEEPEDLVEMLEEYRRFKQVAALLREREETGLRAFGRLAPPPEVPALPGLSQVTLDRLAAVVRRALAQSVPPPEPEPLRRPRFSVRQKMAEIELVLGDEAEVELTDLLHRCCSREEIVTCFLAVLELIKQQRLVARQDGAFAPIILARAVPEAVPEGATA